MALNGGSEHFKIAGTPKLTAIAVSLVELDKGKEPSLLGAKISFPLLIFKMFIIQDASIFRNAVNYSNRL